MEARRARAVAILDPVDLTLRATRRAPVPRAAPSSASQTRPPRAAAVPAWRGEPAAPDDTRRIQPSNTPRRNLDQDAAVNRRPPVPTRRGHGSTTTRNDPTPSNRRARGCSAWSRAARRPSPPTRGIDSTKSLYDHYGHPPLLASLHKEVRQPTPASRPASSRWDCEGPSPVQRNVTSALRRPSPPRILRGDAGNSTSCANLGTDSERKLTKGRRTSNLRGPFTRKLTELWPVRKDPLQCRGKSGGSGGARTRNLCRDRAAL